MELLAVHIGVCLFIVSPLMKTNAFLSLSAHLATDEFQAKRDEERERMTEGEKGKENNKRGATVAGCRPGPERFLSLVRGAED